MISASISYKVLTVGCAWRHPKGGIGVVLNSYSRIYPVFNNVVNSNSINKLVNLLQLFYAFVAVVLKLLFNREITIVHIHTASNNSFRRSVWFSNIAKFLGRKVVMHIHGGGFKDYYEKNVTFVRHELEKCDVVVALTDSWMRFFKDNVGIEQVVVVPNIVESPVQLQQTVNDGRLRMLFLGLLSPQKGVFDLLEVCFKYKTELEDKVELHIGGNGDSKKLIEEIENKGLNKFVFYEGWVSGDVKQRLLNSSDIFILPSYTEGLPISLLEAMSYKLPIISTPVGGIPEIVKDGENGLLIEPGDYESMYNAINIILNNNELRKNMGMTSYKQVSPHLPESVSESLEHMYKILLNS